MKLRISKKLLTIVLLSLLVLLLSVLSYFLVKGFPISLGIYKLNKYQDISDICSRRIENDDFVIQCEGFLEGIELKEDGKTCLKISVITKETFLEQFDICESNSVIQITDAEINSEMLVPISMKISYEYEFPIKYELKSIEISHLEDEKTFKILKDLSQNSIDLYNIGTTESLEIEKNGYYLTKDIPINNDKTKYIETITFTDVSIEEILSKNDGKYINFSIILKSEKESLVTKVKNFKYLESAQDLEFTDVQEPSIESINKEKDYSAVFIYIPKESALNNQDINTYCLGTNIEWVALCNVNIQLNEETILIENVEDYIVSDGEKDNLFLNYLISNE